MRTPMTLLLPLALVVSLPAVAENLFRAVEVPEHELAEMRGRYALPNGIVSFGVVMQSQWNGPQGQLAAKVGLQFRHNSALPVLNVDLQESGQGQAPTGLGQVSGGNGLNSAQGVVQSVRIAGDGNRGLNDVQIHILRGGQAGEPGTSSGALNQSVEGALGRAEVIAKNGGLQISIDAGSLGRTQHSIGSGGIRQNTAISGQQQAVSNLAALQVVLRERGATDSMALQGVMAQLRGLRGNGF